MGHINKINEIIEKTNDFMLISNLINLPSLDSGSVKAVYYDGLNYEGKSTKVFAYIGYPEGASELNKVPAVVCAHGGNGTAYADWVRLWNSKGYAAIAMDLEGQQPTIAGGYIPVSHEYGGPARDGNFNDINKSVEDQWAFHAVADVILANSLLRNDSKIDSSKIGLTGISWGGVITSLVIGNDNRFAFAIPVYGCGYIVGQNNYFGLSYTNNPTTQIWEPSLYIKYAKMPVLWLNDDIDMSFPVISTSLSYQNTFNATLSIKNGFNHGHIEGWSQNEIYAFADSIVKNGKPLIRIVEQPTVLNNSLKLSLQIGVTVSSAKIYYSLVGYTYDSNSDCIADWQNQQALINNDIVTFNVPSDTKAYYIAIFDNRELIVASQIVTIN